MADQTDRFAIHAACREGQGAQPGKSSSIVNNMKLTRAYGTLVVTVVESLLNADPKLANRKDDDGRLPIHWAASSNQLEIVRLLIQVKGFDPDVQDDSGWTPLMIAASVRDAEPVVDLLLNRGASVDEKNHNGQTALHFVASKSNIDLAKKLLEGSPSASARVRDKRGQYAIHRAAAVGSTPMVTLLLKHRSPLNATDNYGQTALHHAVAEGHGDTAVALLKAGAETEKKDQSGFLALDLAPDKEVRKYIIQAAEREGIELA
ncbi:26S proteasome non-ATPase regulatory subunit 10 [Sporothrix schenckii 1099-18]|uniref:26S proteasome non-ATPase regulatory subunit 10 n=1 Tax=Sporothrix schenckii 1099-18 TaxID=1397361 RepID=A0A0F2M0K9_SPOSC|nr:26S proteasome non-ATPase regulatory subunit 10 [Sporothrix schenckii 1099-18]KJR82609.1 26S proteasome non-ATPase regulatory subunit 10 [Sporothrix schenckii 1099-18]